MDELDRKFLSTWEATRAKGKLSFAIREGLSKGTLFSVAIELGSATLFNSETYTFDISRNALRLALFIAGYFCYGLWLWHANEKRYGKLTASK
jgi:hypothetical protein